MAQIMTGYNEAKVGFYDFYSTSAVYYSGKTAVKLTPAGATPQPGGLDWSSKYTMPTEPLAKFVTDSAKGSIVIIVPEEKRKSFLAEVQDRNPELVESKNGYNYYCLDGR